MVSVKEVQADKIILQLKEALKQLPEIEMPHWAKFVKTGPHAERQPEQSDWWYIRAASLLRKIYITPGIGISRLRTWYGGRKNRGRKTEIHVNASGKIIRVILQQLEKAGLLKKQKTGRILTEKGRSLIDKFVNKIKGETLGPRARRAETKKTEDAGTATGGDGGTAKAPAVRAAKKIAVKKTPKPRSAGETGKNKDSKPKSG